MADEPRPLEGPSMAYWPKEVTPLCEATKDILLWMRNQGFRCAHLEVTDKGVLMHGLEDDYPAKALRGGAASPSTGDPPPSPSYDYPDQ